MEIATKNIAIIGIGSNIDAEKNIAETLKILSEKFELMKVSKFLKTHPIGIENQPDFTNGAAKIATSFDKKTLKAELKVIEDQLFRDRTAPKFGPRTIDLDLIVWNGKIVDSDYYSRDFLHENVSDVI
jgi:2-amino-4-hydroxy-6-hydroxymethyldihydropteridine diphosphokinase